MQIKWSPDQITADVDKLMPLCQLLQMHSQNVAANNDLHNLDDVVGKVAKSISNEIANLQKLDDPKATKVIEVLKKVIPYLSSSVQRFLQDLEFKTEDSIFALTQTSLQKKLCHLYHHVEYRTLANKPETIVKGSVDDFLFNVNDERLLFRSEEVIFAAAGWKQGRKLATDSDLIPQQQALLEISEKCTKVFSPLLVKLKKDESLSLIEQNKVHLVKMQTAVTYIKQQVAVPENISFKDANSALFNKSLQIKEAIYRLNTQCKNELASKVKSDKELSNFYQQSSQHLTTQYGKINQRLYFNQNGFIAQLNNLMGSNCDEYTSLADFIKTGKASFKLTDYNWKNKPSVWDLARKDERHKIFEQDTKTKIFDILTKNYYKTSLAKVDAIDYWIQHRQPSVVQVWRRDERERYLIMGLQAKMICVLDEFAKGVIDEKGLMTTMTSYAQQAPEKLQKEILKFVENFRIIHSANCNNNAAKLSELNDDSYKKIIVTEAAANGGLIQGDSPQQPLVEMEQSSMDTVPSINNRKILEENNWDYYQEVTKGLKESKESEEKYREISNFKFTRY